MQLSLRVALYSGIFTAPVSLMLLPIEFLIQVGGHIVSDISL